jgi:murein DD-endopeptidase MepM/ murein hydrolase activator NlpD
MGKSAGAMMSPRVLLSLLCAMLFLGAGYPLLIPAQGRRSASKRLADVQRKKKVTQSRLRTIKAKQTRASSDYEATQRRRVTEEARLEVATAAWDQARAELARANLMLRQAEAKRRDHQEMFAERLVEIHERGEVSYLDVFLGSESFADFANQMYLAQVMVEDDIHLLRSLESDEASVSNIRRQVAEQERRAAGYRELVAARQAALEEAMAAQRAAMADLWHDRKRLEAEYAAWDAEIKALTPEIQRLSRTYRVTPWTGRLKPPIAGGARITSGFGMRKHPIYGDWRMHTGVDIAATYGTPIHAAGDGVVISRRTRKGYGNTVIIDHGGGLSTLYAHCSSYVARQGQQVKQGDVIAKVGATGVATGPHVHFEVRVNGKPVDPMKY